MVDGGSGIRQFQFRKPVDELHRLKARGDDEEDEVRVVGGVVHGFGGPEAGIVNEVAVFVHDPLDGGLAVHCVDD